MHLNETTSQHKITEKQNIIYQISHARKDENWISIIVKEAHKIIAIIKEMQEPMNSKRNAKVSSLLLLTTVSPNLNPNSNIHTHQSTDLGSQIYKKHAET
uniref:Uncharacterized protein n=1 Tax=Rhizophora mucronata TaxID=61149 RepID=A0A2P2LEG2_RHIMU